MSTLLLYPIVEELTRDELLAAAANGDDAVVDRISKARKAARELDYSRLSHVESEYVAAKELMDDDLRTQPIKSAESILAQRRRLS